MTDSAQKITFGQIVECILRDSAVWRGISLLHLQLLDDTKKQLLEASIKDFMALNPGALLFANNHGYLILGAEHELAAKDPAYTSVWFGDMEAQWSAVSDAVSKFYTRPPQSNALPASKATCSILIVEDEPLLNKMMTKHMSKFGTVVATSNYREAMANYVVERPDLVFLDIHYKNDDEDGFDVLKNLLITDNNAFVIMVSGDGSLKTKVQALALGAQGFITKPFQPHDFEHYITVHNQRKLS